MNGSKSKTNSSKSSTEGGPAPQRFDVAAMVLLAARCRGAGWRHPHASAAVCTASVHARAAVGARASRRWSLPRWSRGGKRVQVLWLRAPTAAALAQQSCRVAEAEHRDDFCASKCNGGCCVSPKSGRRLEPPALLVSHER